MGVNSVDGTGLVQAYTAARLLNQANQSAARSLEQLASGLRINRASDDPAGLQISERLRAEVRGNARAAMNAMDEIGMLQTADAALGEVQGSLQRINELSVYAANGTLTDEDRAAIQMEVDAQAANIVDIAANAQFNGKSLLGGALGFSADPGALGIAGLNVSTQASASSAITLVQDAISTASDFRSNLGAQQNGLESKVNYLEIAAENTMAAESRIRDLDYAEGVVKLLQATTQAQASMFALAQANLQSKAVLGLLGQQSGK
jgi:flagellin